MDCRLIRLRDSQPIEILEGYVLARAYGAAWRSLHLCEPVGRHTFKGLGLAIEFGSTATAGGNLNAGSGS